MVALEEEEMRVGDKGVGFIRREQGSGCRRRERVGRKGELVAAGIL